MHASVSSAGVRGGADRAAIVRDRRRTVTPSGTTAAVLDGWQALAVGERYGIFVESDARAHKLGSQPDS